MAVDAILDTANDRRRIAFGALRTAFDASDDTSAVSRFAKILDGPPRPMLVSADIDGLVSAAMLAEAAPGWHIAGFVSSSNVVIHGPAFPTMPPDIFGVDVFSPSFDNISNHMVLWGDRKYQQPVALKALQEWDAHVLDASARRLLAVPGIWAGTQAGYETATPATSAKYKYPLGSAQLVLALLEAAGSSPTFLDRTYLPWLVANCDGGIPSYTKHSYNARIWWPALAGVVGHGSLSGYVLSRVETMRGNDFSDAVNSLDRERQAAGEDAWLNDDWNLRDKKVSTLVRTLRWIRDITGWPDPVIGGTESVLTWSSTPVAEAQHIYFGGTTSTNLPASKPYKIQARTHETDVAISLLKARDSLNANFYVGGVSGSRFNWVGGW